MKSVIRIRLSSIVISILILSVLLLTQCINKHSDTTEATGKINFQQFAGSSSCAGCHKNIYDSHIHTAHYLSSQPAGDKNIKGNFQAGKNLFVFDSHNTIVMERRNNGYYQVQYVNGVEKKARRFDITIGSATRGQTYLYWWKDTLFQLPLTYLTSLNQWCNSPGYPGKVAFGRPVTSRCLECHTTYARTLSSPEAQVEKFDHNILYGVDCEKCHGPAAQHVQFQTQHPNESIGKYIINPVPFSRQQKLDLCILCHGGRLSKIKPSFEFQAGDSLSNYFVIDSSAKDAADIDVHGNQYGLLAASKCFRMSQMTCNTCHSPHKNEAGEIALFSQRCISCHHGPNEHICKMSKTIGSMINQNCIDCHLPNQPSKAIVVLLQGENRPTAALMRSHLIKYYPDETKKFLLLLKNNKHPLKKTKV